MLSLSFQAGAAIFGCPVVWTMIVVNLIGGAMFRAWQAMVTDSNYLLTVEYWVDTCVRQPPLVIHLPPVSDRNAAAIYSCLETLTEAFASSYALQLRRYYD